MSVAVNCRVKDTKMKPFSCKACIFCICKHTNTIKTRRQMNKALHEYIFSVDCIIKGDFIHMEMFGRTYKTNKKFRIAFIMCHWCAACQCLGTMAEEQDVQFIFHVRTTPFISTISRDLFEPETSAADDQLASYSCKCELQVLQQLQLKSHFIPC